MSTFPQYQDYYSEHPEFANPEKYRTLEERYGEGSFTTYIQGKLHVVTPSKHFGAVIRPLEVNDKGWSVYKVIPHDPPKKPSPKEDYTMKLIEPVENPKRGLALFYRHAAKLAYAIAGWLYRQQVKHTPRGWDDRGRE